MGLKEWLKSKPHGAVFDGGSRIEVTTAIARSGSNMVPVVNAIMQYISKQRCSPQEISTQLEDMERIYATDTGICSAFRFARLKTGLPESTVLPRVARPTSPTGPSTTQQRMNLMRIVVPHLWPGRRVDMESYSSLSSVTGQGGVNVYRKGVKGKWDVHRVRSISEGEDLIDAQFKDLWPALLLVIDLYSEILQDMGDDEFFPPKTERFSDYNPFALDELVDFSSLLLNLSFALWWNELPTTSLVLKGVPVTWKQTREKVTNLLIALRSRDCRRSYTSPRHWEVLPSSQFRPHSMALVEEFNETSSQLVSETERMATERVVTLLKHIPFAVPFDDRVFLFRQFIKDDRMTSGGGRSSQTFYPRPVRRDHLSDDGYDHFCSVDVDSLKGRIRINFIDRDGNTEQGLDGGGLWKEFVTTLLEESFELSRGLWAKNEDQELYPFPQAYARQPQQLKWYKFMGRMLGKALYDNILIESVFAKFFLAKWVGESGGLDQLASLDSGLHRVLVALKQWENEDYLDPDTCFDIVDMDMDRPVTVELCPNGSKIQVTKENRLKYIELICKHRLDDQIQPQTQAFLAGLSDMIRPRWLKIFDSTELQMLLGGADKDVDVEDWMRNTSYEGNFSAHHPTITLFWEVVKSLDHQHKRLLLRFVTSCSRPPLLGFVELKPKFTVRYASDDQMRLPTAATCFSTLKLPHYQTKAVLHDKLMQAITANAGFDLS